MLKFNTMFNRYKQYITFLSFCLILGITFFLYLPAIDCNFISWDDPGYLITNPLIKELSWNNFKSIFTNFYNPNYHYQPLTILSYAFEYKFFELNPHVYHLTNLIFHLINVILVFQFIFLLTKNKISSLIVSLLFALHPLNVESVTWVTSRKNVLFAFFYLTSLITYIYYLNDKKIIKLLSCFIFFVLAVLSKPSAVTLPIILLVIDYYLLNKIKWRNIIEKSPFFILSFIMGILILWDAKQPFLGDYPLDAPTNNLDIILFNFYALWFYFYKLIWPSNLSIYYPFPNTTDSLLYLSPILCVVFIWLGYKYCTNKKRFIFGFVFFLITISLNLPFNSIKFTIVADRFVYLSYIGLFLIITELGTSFLKNKTITKLILISILILSYVLSFGFQTYKRNSIWLNDFTLWNDVIKKYPQVALAYYFRGNTQKTYTAALNDYSTAINLMPNYFTVYNNRGALYLINGQYELAMSDFNQAIKFNPNYIYPLYNRAQIYKLSHMNQEYISDLKKILEIDPSDQKVQTELKAVENSLYSP